MGLSCDQPESVDLGLAAVPCPGQGDMRLDPAERVRHSSLMRLQDLLPRGMRCETPERGHRLDRREG